MNKLKTALMLMALAVLLGGCPYESKVPLDKPSIKINEDLLGNYRAEKDKLHYTVNRLNKFTYKIDEQKDSGEVKIYYGYLSNVGKEQFLNVYDPAETTPEYMFYKVATAPDGKTITLSSVTENIDEKFEKAEDLKAFFEKNKDLSFFFEKEDLVLTKLP